MSKTDLHRLEQQTYRSYFQDGLVDLGVGLLVVGFGVTMLTRFPVTAIVAALLLPLGSLLKKHVTYARLGYVKFAPARMRAGKRHLILLLGLGALLLLATASLFMGINGGLVGFESWARANTGLFLGIIVAAGVGMGAVLLGIHRFWGYAVVALVSFTSIDYVTAVHPGYIVTGGGSLIVLAGLWVLTTFMRNNPVPNGDAND